MPYDYRFVAARKPVEPGVHVVRSGADDYATSCALFNRALNFSPAWIAYPYNEAEIVQAVNQAVAEGLPIAVRSGRHDYEGFSMNNGGAVIDTSRCNFLRMEGNNRCVIGAGALLRQIYHELMGLGGRILPGGTCGSVGVAGLTLGGGFGNLGRSHGLTCDWLRRVRMVDAGGRALDSRDDPIGADLLWACRGGGGGNFGVITEFEFEVVTVPNEVTSFSYKWEWSPDAIRSLFEAYEAWVVSAPRAIGATLVITGKASNTLHFFGQSLLSANETSSLISDVVQSTPDSIEAVVEMVPFLGQIERYAGNDYAGTAWKMASTFSKEPVPPEGVEAVINALSEAPEAALIEFDALGGAVGDLAPDATAFAHRDQRLMWQYQTYWSNPTDASACREWVSRAFTAIDPFTSAVSYRNYCDLNLADWAQRYYGANYSRLQDIKRRLDSENVFRFQQSIQLEEQ